MKEPWVGRFAPTPSGPLHFGSLVAALGSYLIARHQGGEWLVRIEDLDPPREVPGASEDILKTLESFGFEWDRSVVYQSQRQPHYSQILKALDAQLLLYHCECSRAAITKRNHGIYDGFCQQRQLTDSGDSAIRIKFNQSFFNQDFSLFTDEILGECQFNQPVDIQDFIIRRRDGFFAYQLAVVVDDIEQQVNHVARGADILDSTPRQNFLYHCLGQPAPAYFHLPLVVDQQGNKMSKSQFSSAITVDKASAWLVKALVHLGQLHSGEPLHSALKTERELIKMSPQEILQWATKNWKQSAVGVSSKVY